jgi:beta-glucosidase
MRQLKGFERLALKPGETKTVRFTLTPAHLEFWNAQGKRVVEPGEFQVFVGGSSATALEGQFAVE